MIEDFINDNYDDLLSLLETLCKIPAPSNDEGKRASFCKEWLEKCGYKPYIDEALNVILPLNCEHNNKITVFAAHTDTVFPNIESMPYIDDGEKIHCPGCGDDTASLAVLLYLAKYIKEKNIKPKNGILIVCNSGEEGLGNLKGTRKLFKDFGDRISHFITFDSNIDIIADRCVGSCRYKVTVKTAGGHSYLNFGNRSAINILSQIIQRLYNIYIPNDDNSKTTLNVGRISGGTSVNTIAQNAEMLCEYRSDNIEQLKHMKRAFFEIFCEAKEKGVEIETEVVGERPCAKGVVQNEIDKLKSITFEIIREVLGKDPKFTASSTDCNIPLSLGIPAICIGVYNGGGQHTREEWIEKISLKQGLEIAIRTFTSLCYDEKLQ